MKSLAWLRRAPWLAVFGIVALAAGAVQAQSAPAKYWLNIRLGAVPPALNEQLELKGEGVLVEHVASGGPADKAGIKRHDIVLALGDKPVKSPSDLESAVAEGNVLSLKLMRAGKPVTVTVTPEQRPEGVRDGRRFRPEDLGDVRDIEKMVREKMKEAGVDGLRMRWALPGKILPPGTPFSISLDDFPEDLTVNIHKHGASPAEIEVKKGDKTWNVKEGDLASLPDEVRPHVEALLGRGRPFRLLFKGPDGSGPGAGPQPPEPPTVVLPPEGPAPGVGGPSARPDGPPGRPSGRGGPGRPGRPDDAAEAERGPGPQGRVDERLERRLKEMNRRLQEMREQIESLHRSLRPPRDDERS